MKHKIGVHIRPAATFTETIQQALALQVPRFQTFAVPLSGKYIKLTPADRANFLELRRQYFQDLYLHGSYWINLCRENPANLKTTIRELKLAQQLEFTHLVIHPGSAIRGSSKAAGLKVLAQSLNQLLSLEQPVKIVLENTAHGNLTLGSDLNDFAELLQLLAQPEKLWFCIDTSHAYAYGYNLQELDNQAQFNNLIAQTMGWEKVCLIHLNDTAETLGRKIDKHAVPGAGQIGTTALTHFLRQPAVKNIPVIIEPPANLTPTETAHILNEIDQWLD